MSKICKKCNTLITFGDNNYCELCANILVADLEAKLAEKQKLLEDSIDVHEMGEKDIYKLRYELAGADETIQQLKQQLTEKDKEIESLKIDLESKDFNINTLMEQRKRRQKFYNQDKISFCIEQLEKVKLYNRQRAYNYMPLTNFIDNQIEELKKGSE